MGLLRKQGIFALNLAFAPTFLGEGRRCYVAEKRESLPAVFVFQKLPQPPSGGASSGLFSGAVAGWWRLSFGGLWRCIPRYIPQHSSLLMYGDWQLHTSSWRLLTDSSLLIPSAHRSSQKCCCKITKKKQKTDWYSYTAHANRVVESHKTVRFYIAYIWT